MESRTTMASDRRLGFGFSAFVIVVVGSSGLALAQSDRARVADNRINRCSVYGSDFVQIEGTDACARVGGHIRVEIGVGNGLRSGFNRSDSDGARPAGLSSGQSAGDPPFGDMQGSSHGHLRVAPLPGSRDLFAR
jgi:hypothetical protein